MSNLRKRTVVAVCALTTAMGVFFVGGKFGAKIDAGTPADKVTVAGSNFTVIGDGTTKQLLKATMKTSNPEDLIFQVTAECSIITQVFSTGNGTPMTSYGEVDIQVKIDGQPVPVVSVPGQNAQKPTSSLDDGRIVFCDRVNTQTLQTGSASNMLTEYLQTKEAAGFNWAAFNVGQSSSHVITVEGTFCTSTTAPPYSISGTNDPQELATCTDSDKSAPSCLPTPMPGTTCSDAVVGDRTLIVSPTSLAQNQTG